MFYSSQLLSRKTPLGICWLASHSESKRLKRAQVGIVLDSITEYYLILIEESLRTGCGTRGTANCATLARVDLRRRF